MVSVRVQTVIDRPAAEVFDFLADPSNNPTWQVGLKQVVMVSRGELGEGSTYTQQAKFLGRHFDATFIVVDFAPGRSISVESLDAPFPMGMTRTVEALQADRCQVTKEMWGRPTGVLKLFGTLFEKFVARSVRRDFARLGAFLDSN